MISAQSQLLYPQPITNDLMHQESDVARVWAVMKVQAASPFPTFSILPFSQIPVKTSVDTADTLSVKPNPCQAQGWACQRVNSSPNEASSSWNLFAENLLPADPLGDGQIWLVQST